jgi:YVTN family beta-propeller protein
MRTRNRISLFLATALAAIAAGSYHVIRKIPLEGNGFWDYTIVDSAARRLYVSHGNEVQVIDVDSAKVVGTISDLHGVHGIAPAPDLGRGFISNGQSNTVTVFDLASLKRIADVEAGQNPDAIIYDPATQRVFANNGHSDSTTAIDAAQGKVAGTIPLGGGPEYSAADGKGDIYTNLEDKSELLRIDGRALKVRERWPLKPCESPSSMAMDKTTRRIFIGCRNKVMAVVDADSGKVIATPAIGAGVDATSFDPGAKLIFDSCGDGTLSVFHEDSPDTITLVETVQTVRGARTNAVDTKTHHVFLPVAETVPLPAGQRGRPSIKPGTFQILEVGA